MGTVEHMGRGAGRISGDLGDLLPSPRPRPRTAGRVAPPRQQRDPVRTAVRTFGEVLITLGLVVLLFVVYEVYWTDLMSAGKQRDVTAQLDDRWKGEADPQRVEHFDGLGEGEGFAKMYIPAFGADFDFTIVEGTTAASLDIGPGHYTDTAYPGELGNFAVAGHRAKAMFWDLDKLKPGDKIFVEDKEFFYEYVITETKIVLPNAVEVVAPVPGKPGEKPKDAMLTLTTCNPKWDNYERLIVHAKATGDPRSKAMGMPPELGS